MRRSSGSMQYFIDARVPPGTLATLDVFGAWFEPFVITVAVWGSMICLVALVVFPLLQLAWIVVLSPILALVQAIRRFF